jgi:hypothetical protein
MWLKHLANCLKIQAKVKETFIGYLLCSNLKRKMMFICFSVHTRSFMEIMGPVEGVL